MTTEDRATRGGAIPQPPIDGDAMLHPPIQPGRTGTLRVSPRHELYFETFGSEGGLPVIGLHGGPGSGCGERMRRFFDPARFRVLLFDQRGAGRSTPRGEWRDNTTNDLIADIDHIRAHAGIEDPAILFGGSWGATLALAYAQARPERVAALMLRGVFLARRRDIDHFYHGGVAPQFPEAWERLRSLVPHPDRFDYPDQIFRMIDEGDAASRERALLGFARYELRLSEAAITDEECDKYLASNDVSAVSILENHYMRRGCFLEEGQLLRDAGRIAHLPTVLVTGRYDVICPPAQAFALAAKLDDVHVDIVAGAAHSSREPAIVRALQGGLDRLASRLRDGSRQ